MRPFLFPVLFILFACVLFACSARQLFCLALRLSAVRLYSIASDAGQTDIPSLTTGRLQPRSQQQQQAIERTAIGLCHLLRSCPHVPCSLRVL